MDIADIRLELMRESGADGEMPPLEGGSSPDFSGILCSDSPGLSGSDILS
jgi:hypothetical protein